MLRVKLGLTLIVLSLVSGLSLGYAAGPTFSVEEIVRAAKDEVMAAQGIESADFKIVIERFELHLAVVAIRNSKSDVRFEVAGLEVGAEDGFSKGTIHHVKLKMTPSQDSSVTTGYSNLGLLPAIRQIKTNIRKACNVMPSCHLNSLGLELEFAVEQTDDEGFRFVVIEAGRPEYKRYATHRLMIHMSLSEKVDSIQKSS